MNDNSERFHQIVEFIQAKWDHHVELMQTVNALRYSLYEQCVILLKLGRTDDVIHLLDQLRASIYDDVEDV